MARFQGEVLPEASLHNFEKKEKIEEGTYGVVYKAFDRKRRTSVFMKHIPHKFKDAFSREVSMLRELRHPNIVNLQQVIMKESQLYLIFDFDISVNLGEYLLGDGFCLELKAIKGLLYQMTQAMCFCHQREVLHRDLKPQNILINPHGMGVKLSDFGLAHAIKSPPSAETHELVTLLYCAPEVFLGAEKYSMAVDVWSIGCVFAEMVTKTPLFAEDSKIEELFKTIGDPKMLHQVQVFSILGTPDERTWPGVTLLRDFKSDIPQCAGNKLKTELGDLLDNEGLILLQKMLTYNPVHRVSCKKILQDPYFNDVDKSTLPAGSYDGTQLAVN
uniref:Protein kinase domain-containing protein n=1 Tax=Steinernema glaseri TaxID=37863 RepID=A0A1I8AUV0_9BILA